MTAPPRLFSVPAGDDPAAMLLKEAGADEAHDVEAETVEAVPVDDPAPAAAGWMAERQGRLAEAPRVVPVWLRDRAQLADNTKFIARWYGREWGYYGLRTPVYLGRLWGRAPRGGARLGGRWYRWVVDADAKPVTHKAAAGDVDQWMRLAQQQTNRTNGRRKASLFVGIPAAYAVYLLVVLLPPWVSAVAVAGLLTALGWAGRDSDRPIVHRYVSVQLQRRLDSNEVEQALEAIGIKGRVDWVNPIATDGPGWLAEVDLPRGYLAEDVLEKRAQLAAAMRRPLGCVWPETDRDAHPGRLKLWVARQDPAKAQRRLWPLLAEGQVDMFTEIPYGFDPRGRLVMLRLMNTNVLIGGVMGSGKTSAVLVIALSGALDPTCELWLYEMKGSGDLETLQPICHRYVQGDDDEHAKAALDGLKALEREMKRRKKVVADLPAFDVPEGRKVYPHLAKRKELGLHPILAIFDEAHTLFEHPEYGEEAAAVAGRLIRKARAYAIVLVITTQRPDTKAVPRPISDNAITRLLLAVAGHISNDLIAGTGAYKRGVRGTMFDPERDAGTAWLIRSALNAQIVRAAFIKQGEAAAIGRRALALRIAAGTLSGEAAGDVVEQVDDSTLIDHIRAVWPAGEDAVHSARLVQALAVYRPDFYGGWLPDDLEGLGEDEQREARSSASTMLANALKPFGVQTRQINRRGAGGGGKGIRWDDLPALEDVSVDR